MLCPSPVKYHAFFYNYLDFSCNSPVLLLFCFLFLILPCSTVNIFLANTNYDSLKTLEFKNLISFSSSRCLRSNFKVCFCRTLASKFDSLKGVILEKKSYF